MTCFILVEVLMKMHFQYTSNKLKPLLCKVVLHRTVINMKRYHMSVISKKNIRLIREIDFPLPGRRAKPSCSERSCR